MSSPLIAVPATPQSPANSTVTADGWYPDIDCNQVRDVLRLGDVVTHQRLRDALQGGLITVTSELAEWRAAREAEGIAALSEIEPDNTIDGMTRQERSFIRAVRFAAAAELAETHRDISTTNEGQIRTDAQTLTAADYHRMCTWAIRDILRTTRTAVELI